MKSIKVQEGGLEGVGTGFVLVKLKSELLIIFVVSKFIKFLIIESEYIRV